MLHVASGGEQVQSLGQCRQHTRAGPVGPIWHGAAAGIVDASRGSHVLDRLQASAASLSTASPRALSQIRSSHPRGFGVRRHNRPAGAQFHQRLVDALAEKVKAMRGEGAFGIDIYGPVNEDVEPG